MALQRQLKRFPLSCTDEAPPQPTGLIDDRGLRTPPYAYGWLVPYDQLVAAAVRIMGKAPKVLTGLFVNARWTELGYADTYGRTLRLKALPDERAEAVLVYIGTNRSPEKMQFLVSDLEYRNACKDCLGNPPTMMDYAPRWFRVDIRDVPEDYPYKFESCPSYLHMMGI